MTMLKHHGSLALLAVALGSAVSLPAAAQERSEVREVLSRAETQAARRAVEELLGSIGGIGRAEAQTLPARGGPAATEPAAQPQSPRSATPPATAAQPPAPTVAAGGAAPVAVAPAAAGSPIGAGGPNAVVPSAATGTPARPTMIVRVPGTPEQPAAQSSAPQPGAAIPAEAVAADAGVAQGRAESTAAPSAGPVRSGAPAAVVAARPVTGAPISVAVRLASGRMIAQEWCPPARR